jgi:hypothetical protein
MDPEFTIIVQILLEKTILFMALLKKLTTCTRDKKIDQANHLMYLEL